MDQERIQELAVLQATTGLLGADLLEFEIWWRTAPADERAHYTETLDTIAMISQSHIPARKPSPLVKSEIMASLSDSPRRGSKGKNQPAVAGYAVMMEAEGDWRELPTKGTRVKELFCSREAGTATFVLEMDPGTRLLSHHHQGAEEAFVLYGDLQMRGKVLRSGDYMRAEPGTKHEDLYSEGGCRALVITALENYPRRSIRVYNGLHRAWQKCKSLVGGH